MVTLGKGEYLGENITRFESDGLTIVDTSYRQPVYSGWHSHHCAHLTLVLNGGNLEKRPRRELQLSSGQVVFYHHGELHRNDHTLFPSRNINLELSEDFFLMSGLTPIQLEKAVAGRGLQAADIIRVLHELFYPGADLQQTATMILGAAASAPLGRLEPDWVAVVRTFLEDNWYRWPGLVEIAEAAGVHPITISKSFSRYFSGTLSSYTRKLKVGRAVALIRSGKYSLTTVALMCGFADQSHFIRAFKANTGLLPKAFERW
ncbi:MULTISPECIES: helix-turn-helix transcriptional regulator [Pedobacter]|uniref:helix-turn-helix transcriptional regulator n=1 Tax=Pedobacter TaxID=84567 RepID=UPI00210A6015|nr:MULTISPECIES: helix-turn-helix transcriptional regulator [unclassified Pedobacter]